MRRIVFFGMNGGYSAVTLNALVTSGLAPVLVVRGIAKALVGRTATVELTRAKKLFDRLKTAVVGLPAGASGASGAESSFEIADGSSMEEKLIDAKLEETAMRLGIDVLTTTDANVVRARAHISSAEPDLFVVAGFPHLLSKDVLGLAKRGGINLHPGKLPRERGPSPLFWALREGRNKIAFTVHVIDEGEDSGDIISGGEVDFAPGLDGEVILTRCARSAAPHVVRAVRGLFEGDLVRMPQPVLGRGRCPRPAFRDGRIDVSKNAREVFTFVSGCARTHSIYAECGGDRFFIREAESFDEAGRMPSEYLLTGDRLLLKCNPGVVELVLKEQGALFTAEYTEEH